jgi:dipeptidyl-peptidase-4
MPSLRRVAVVVVVAIVCASAPRAQQGDVRTPLQAQIDRIFKDRAYEAPRFGPARWLADGSAYAIVERTGGQSEIARYDARSGERTVLARTALDIEDYAWSRDGQRLLVFTNTKKVWRQNTRGDYYVIDVASGRQTKLGGSAPESSLMFAKFSPDGTRVAYVRQNNIYAEQLESGDITQLTVDGSRPAGGAPWAPATPGTIVNGTSDWVNEEELDIRDGFRWSPDGRRIAYWQFDTSGVGTMTLINDTAALYPTTISFAYPKPGTTNSAVRIGVVPAAGGTTTWMKTPGDPRNTYLASLDWIDASTVAMQQLNRLQNEDDYLLGDAATGDVTRVFQDTSFKVDGHATWVDAQEDVEWIDGDRAFLWLSERDGWRHIYREARGERREARGERREERDERRETRGEGGEPLLVTRFNADVTELVAVDDKDRVVYFLASPGNPTQRYLYRAPLDGSAAPVRVTPADQPGWHSYTPSPGAKLAFHTYSSFDRVTAMDVVSLPEHRSLRKLTDPSALQATLSELLRPPVEFVKAAVGNGVTLDGWVLKPASFDPSKKYPVIVQVYGEPASQTVTDRWGGNTALFHRALADAGYIVVSFDNRGTPAPKGAAWRKVIYGAVGELAAAEQAAAVKAFAASHAYVDVDRIGIWGWSGGGSNTLNCMFRDGDVFKVGVAVAPVPDQKLYDTIYQERYMGLPEQNEDGYGRGSSINFADRLVGRLLVVHGSGDDNVHYQGTERLVNRLVELGKRFDLMVYPNRTHSISEGPGTTPHVYQLIARYFLANLPAGAR